jgi:ribosomal protein S14
MKMLDRIRGHKHPEAATRGSHTCATCGRPALTTDQFVVAAKKAGFEVDPLTGDEVPIAVSGVAGGIGDLVAWERDRQQRFDAVEARRGYLCRSCHKAHCTACLMSTPQHPVTSGPRCPSCGEGPHGLLED